jgi:hypothetical protein
LGTFIQSTATFLPPPKSPPPIIDTFQPAGTAIGWVGAVRKKAITRDALVVVSSGELYA